jgi:pimeloyl-ACP methyl ester carboxylesterase
MGTVTSADGTLIDYDAYGSGPPVILIGGASQYRAIDSRTTEIAKHLAEEGFTAVDYDRRGRGRSGDTPPWSLDREVEDLAALIEATGVPALYTSSSGAGVACRGHLRHPSLGARPLRAAIFRRFGWP